VFNSIIVGYPWGISLRDVYTHKWAWTDNELEVKNMSLGASEWKLDYTPTVMDSSRWVAGSSGAVDSCTSWFNRGIYYNYGSQTLRHCADVGLVNMTDIHSPNPVPAVGSEPDGSADFSPPRLAGFQVVDYRGAFDPDVPLYEQWIHEWTNFAPEITEYNPAMTAVEEMPLARSLSQNFPNPFNPVTRIKFSVPKTGHVSLIVYNVKGERVATLVNGEKAAGDHEVSFNAKGMASGTYFYTFKTAGIKETRKMVLLR
jgi:hypothetical protein